MFFQFITNFAFLFTFTVLTFWPFIHYSKRTFFLKYKAIIVGITFGIAAIVLTLLTSSFANGVLINSRSIFLLFGGLLGGPTTILIAGLMIVISRPIFGFTSLLSIIMMVNMLLVTLSTAYVAIKKPITYQNITLYFFAITFEHIIVLLIYYKGSLEGIIFVSMLFIFSITTFFAIHNILQKLENTNTQVRQIYTIGKTDFLTQLPNNAGIEQRLQLLIQEKIPFELLHINLQQFKYINMHYTYETGDRILIEVSDILQQQLTKEDMLLGRPGNDEFYVILPNTAPALAMAIAYNIQQAIEQHTFSLLEHTKPLSVAIGICSYPQNGTRLELIYQGANYALQQAQLQKNIPPICHFNQLGRYHE